MANLFPGHQKTSAPEQNIEKPKTAEVLGSPVPEVSESEWETDVTEDEQEQVMIIIILTIILIIIIMNMMIIIMMIIMPMIMRRSKWPPSRKSRTWRTHSTSCTSLTWTATTT